MASASRNWRNGRCVVHFKRVHFTREMEVVWCECWQCARGVHTRTLFSHTLSSLTHCRTHMLGLLLTQWHTGTLQTRTLAHSHTHTPAHSHTRTLSQSHWHTQTLAHSQTHTLTHSHTRSRHRAPPWRRASRRTPSLPRCVTHTNAVSLIGSLTHSHSLTHTG